MLIIVRGLPGSGKSTLATALKQRFGLKHVEADQYFVSEGGEYKFVPERIKDAHAWCQSTVKAMLEQGKSVVISNTFTRLWEMEPYLKMDVPYVVVQCTGDYGNVHGVPDHAIDHMRERWEDYPDAILVGREITPDVVDGVMALAEQEAYV